MAGRVEGKVAFITGATRGQGRAHTVRLAEEGTNIIAVDLAGPLPGVPYDSPTPEDPDETVRQVEDRDRRIMPEVAEVRDLETMRSVVDRAVAELGRLDVVVANAGINRRRSPPWCSTWPPTSPSTSRPRPSPSTAVWRGSDPRGRP